MDLTLKFIGWPKVVGSFLPKVVFSLPVIGMSEEERMCVCVCVCVCVFRGYWAWVLLVPLIRSFLAQIL